MVQLSVSVVKTEPCFFSRFSFSLTCWLHLPLLPPSTVPLCISLHSLHQRCLSLPHNDHWLPLPPSLAASRPHLSHPKIAISLSHSNKQIETHKQKRCRWSESEHTNLPCSTGGGFGFDDGMVATSTGKSDGIRRLAEWWFGPGAAEEWTVANKIEVSHLLPTTLFWDVFDEMPQ
ncbi:hypothetical protein RIF29_39183 [Crotalaria pallida]|uniref:Uncharacterized protein n=1 Tax=Crotalaria pallida TaxID=3830 RepID=A0AAN9E368_CROPI